MINLGVRLALLLGVFQTAFCGDYCHGSNFMTADSIKKKSPFCFNDLPDTVKPVRKGLYLMPEMNFTCSGVIKSILVGAKIISTVANSQLHPELQIWRKAPTTTDQKDESTTDQRDESTRDISAHNSVILVSSHAIDIPNNYFSSSVYSYFTFHKPIEFNEGDFIGFYQPSNETDIIIFYTTETFMPPQTAFVNYDTGIDDLSTNVSLSLDSLQTLEDHYLLLRPQAKSSCLGQFLDYGEVKTRAKYISPLKYNHRQLRLFPDIKFDCPLGRGFLTGIKFGAQTRNGVLLPEVQIWRTMAGNANSYKKVHSIPLSENESRVSNVHEVHFDAPVEFQDQDFIGLFQPEVANSRLVVFYQENSGPRNLVVADNIDQPSPTAVTGLNNTGTNDYPLITVEISKVILESTRSSSTDDVYSTLTATTNSLLPSSSQSNVPPTATSDTADDSLIVIIVVVAGVAAVLLMLIAIVNVITAIMCIKVKQGKQQSNNNSDSVAAVNVGPVVPYETKQLQTSQTRNALTMSHTYDECVQMRCNFSYGIVSPKDLQMAINLSYGGQPFNNSIHRESCASSNSYEEYTEEYVLPLPMEDETASHQYY